MGRENNHLNREGAEKIGSVSGVMSLIWSCVPAGHNSPTQRPTKVRGGPIQDSVMVYRLLVPTGGGCFAGRGRVAVLADQFWRVGWRAESGSTGVSVKRRRQSSHSPYQRHTPAMPELSPKSWIHTPNTGGAVTSSWPPGGVAGLRRPATDSTFGPSAAPAPGRAPWPHQGK